MQDSAQHLPDGYLLRLMEEGDYSEIAAICAVVYPTERPYTHDELASHHKRFPMGQFVVEHVASGLVAGAHFTLRIDLLHFHLDDSWDTLTAGGSFDDHDPDGHTLYGADLFVHPDHQHHGIGRALTCATRALVRAERLWRMVGGSRMPGYGKLAAQCAPQEYLARVRRAELVDPVLTAHLHDGWDAVTVVQGYLPNDAESAGWAAVIQWVNPEYSLSPEAELDISNIQRRGDPSGT